MDDDLIQLRLSYLSAEGDFIQARIAFTKLVKAEKRNHQISQALKESLSAAHVYHLSLKRLLEHLLSTQPSEKRTWEIQLTRMKIDILDKEINTLSRLLATLNKRGG